MKVVLEKIYSMELMLIKEIFQILLFIILKISKIYLRKIYHKLIMVGAPGSGKSMMAKRLPSILPPLSLGESLETTKIHSVAGQLKRGSSLISQRPFRDPHHTISQVAMVGGGSFPQPGEISLAHNGVLFLDELFSKLFNYCILLYINHLIRQSNHSIQ